MTRFVKKLCAVMLTCVLTPLLAHAQENSVQGSMHDLSVAGRGPVKATSESGVCIFCHASHVLNSEPTRPLWNQKLSTVTGHSQYSSSTYRQQNAPVSTHSKLCLSCHDGTVAIGQTYSKGRIAVKGSLAQADNLGTDLSNNHPFGFSMPAVDDGEIRTSLTAAPPASSDAAVKLCDNKIECITCHNPHKPNNDSAVQFLARSNTGGALCLACHDPSRGTLKGWSQSQHAVAANTVSRGAQLPYASVAANACTSCHSTHKSPGEGARLLRGNEEASCGVCHGSTPNVSPALRNIIGEIGSQYSHPVGIPVSPVHDPAERLPIAGSRHSECSDCHNPHAAKASNGSSAPAIPQSLNGVTGISASGSIVNPAQHEYEVCFKCHADSGGKPQSAAYAAYGREPVRVTKSIDPYNVRLDLNSSVARHNVVQPARGGVSPSLRTTMLELNNAQSGRSLVASTYLYCADCHANDQARGSGGAAPNGPHGSRWMHLLERQYQQNLLPPQGAGSSFIGIAYTPGPNGPYALCDKCHDLANKLNLSGTGTDSVFGKHNIHVASVGASCSVCHAAHGVQGGTTTNNRHLVNFDAQIVAAYGTNVEPYVDTARRQCFLVCHGVAHNGRSY